VLQIPAIRPCHHPLRGVGSVHLQMMLMLGNITPTATNPIKQENHKCIRWMRKLNTSWHWACIGTVKCWTVQLQPAAGVSEGNKHRRETMTAVDIMNRISAATGWHVNYVIMVITRVLVQYLKQLQKHRKPLLLFRECCSRCRFQPYDCVIFCCAE